MQKDYTCNIIHIRKTPLAEITSDSIVWIYDVVNQAQLRDMLQGQFPAFIVNDHLSAMAPSDYQVYCAPLWLAKNTRWIVRNLPEHQDYQTQYTFNFMINKKQVNRFLCMKLVELLKLGNYDYTWSGVDSRFDMTDILAELSSLGKDSPLSITQRSFLLSEIRIPQKFFRHIGDTNTTSVKYPDNSWTWNHGLNNMFSKSVVSLITESLSFEKSTVFTEKTAYAILGKTFPLWVGGGISQAQRFEEMGFDVFNDVIDHSYQHYDTLVERCYYSFKRNLHILSDYEYASNIRESMMDRLEHNQHLLKNKHVDDFCKRQIEQWPEELQHNIGSELKFWIEG